MFSENAKKVKYRNFGVQVSIHYSNNPLLPHYYTLRNRRSGFGNNHDFTSAS